jgi:hypothetical protein
MAAVSVKLSAGELPVIGVSPKALTSTTRSCSLVMLASGAKLLLPTPLTQLLLAAQVISGNPQFDCGKSLNRGELGMFPFVVRCGFVPITTRATARPRVATILRSAATGAVGPREINKAVSKMIVSAIEVVFNQILFFILTIVIIFLSFGFVNTNFMNILRNFYCDFS